MANTNTFVSDMMNSLLGGSNVKDTMKVFSGVDAHTFDTINYLGNLLSQMIQCFNTDRLIAVSSEEELEKTAASLGNNLLGGIVFLNVPSDSLPSHVKYKIRMPSASVPPTDMLAEP